ncbi:hypothetical protein [Pasteuria penetrans]|uniref:hypothetical protein n=1 Tax=Pasteuria penetrans TaxID=86005 RepID=UPI0011EC3C53|nr:hypothetical protein [Pasteuria penetrans]
MEKWLYTSMHGPPPRDTDLCYPIRFVVARWGWISFLFHFLLFFSVSLYMVEGVQALPKYGMPLMIGSIGYICFSIMVIFLLKKEIKKEKNNEFLSRAQVAARQMIQWSTNRKNYRRAIVQHSLWRRGAWYLVSWGGGVWFLVMTCVSLWTFPSVWLVTLGTVGWMAALRGRIWQEEHWLRVQGIHVGFVNRRIIMCLLGYLLFLHLLHFVSHFGAGSNPSLHSDMIFRAGSSFSCFSLYPVLPSWAHLLLGQRRAFFRPFLSIRSTSGFFRHLIFSPPCNYLEIFDYYNNTQRKRVLQSRSGTKNCLLWVILGVLTLFSLCGLICEIVNIKLILF